jgi:hypothetical protein
LVPGVVPEPYWDFNMGMDFNQYKIKKKIESAIKLSLKDEEIKSAVKGLKYDPEQVFHLRMKNTKLPMIVVNTPNLAYELLICMTHTNQVTRYYDSLSGMKMSTHSLEVFNKLSGQVELP